LKEGFEQQAKRRIGQVRRPKVVTEEDLMEMRKMLQQVIEASNSSEIKTEV